MKILTLDIETAPMVVYSWGLYDQTHYIEQIKDTGGLLSWAAKWHGQKTVYFRSVYHDTDSEFLGEIWDLLDEADAVIHYNGTRFDIPHLNRAFAEASMPPPSPFAEIDLLRTARSKFKFPSNKLQYVAQALGVGSKLAHEGFELWDKCLQGDEKAWATMKKYNKQDVILTEQLYDRLLPWIANHPNRRLFTEEGCPKCGSENLQKRGFRYTAVSKFQAYQCTECGSYFRDTKRVAGVYLR